MAWEAWFTVGVVLAVLGVLMTSRFGSDLVILGAVALLVIVSLFSPREILGTGEALQGMANEGMITVAVLYIVVCGLTKTGAVQWLGRHVLGRPKSLFTAMVRLVVPVSLVSAFMNNTPLVAMLIPVVTDWCRRNGFSSSKLMIPLSYAAILGGTVTLIGTSTNLVVSGMWSASGRPDLGMFDIAVFGIPTMIVGLLYLVFVGRFLLPARNPVLSVKDDAKSYTLEMLVEPAGPLVGRTIEQAGLRGLPGLFLAEIERAGQLLPAVGPNETLHADDRLVFVGILESVVDLRKVRGLAPAPDQIVKLGAPNPQRCLVEAVVSNTNPLVGRTIREGRFRSIYSAVVIAVARNGVRIKNRKIGDIQVHVGDTMLLEAPTSFVEQHRDSRDFYLVSEIADSAPVRHERAVAALAVLVGMVLLATISDILGWPIKMIHAAGIAAGLMMVLRCCSGPEARHSMDWQVLITIAAALALGKALDNTGAARTIADSLVSLASGNPLLTLAMVYFVTTVFTEVITNNAAAALMFPIADAIAERLGVDLKPFALAIMMAASASFCTPIGYQTNLMVMGPGGYRFADYLRIGLPLNIIGLVVTVSCARLFFSM